MREVYQYYHIIGLSVCVWIFNFDFYLLLILVLAIATTGCACPACPALEEGAGTIKAHVVGVLARVQRQVTRRKRHADGDEVVVDEDGVVVLLILLLLCVVGGAAVQGCIPPSVCGNIFVCACVSCLSMSIKSIKRKRRYMYIDSGMSCYYWWLCLLP